MVDDLHIRSLHEFRTGQFHELLTVEQQDAAIYVECTPTEMFCAATHLGPCPKLWAEPAGSLQRGPLLRRPSEGLSGYHDVL